MNNVYESLWFLVHEQSASDNQKQKFADLCGQWGLAHPEKSRYFMTRVYQHLCALPGHQYSLTEGPDLLYQSAMHQYLDACVFDMEKLYEKPQRLTETVGWFCGNDMFALPALVFEKMISLFDENKEPDQMQIEFSDPQEEELEEWERDHSWEEGLADDLHNRFLGMYCEQRLKASVDALNSVFLLHFQKDNVEHGTMLVQAGRLLDWFRDRKNLEKLDAMDQARAVDLCYEMSRELSRAGLYGLEDEYLRFTQSVLLEMDEKSSLNEPLKEALQDTEYRLLQKARLESDPETAREQAALLKDLIEREEREYRTSYQDLLYYEAVRELSRSLEGQKKYLMCADAMSVLEKDDSISDDGARTNAPQIHESILDGWRDLIESALEEGEFQIAANMTLHMMEKILQNSDSPREAAYRRFALSSLVRAFAGSKDKKMAAETAQKMVAVVPDAEYGSSFYTDISYYESAAYLLSLRKPPKEMDIQGFMSRFLQKVPVFSLMEETICDITNTPYISLMYPEKSWKEMENDFFSRELTKKEQDVPQPFWQKDLMITLGAVDRVTDISGFYEFNGCKKKCKEGIRAIENLEKTRGVSLEDTKARLAMMEKIPDLIRAFPDPAVFERMDAADDALKQAEFENPQVQGLLLHQLNCLRAMAAYMQHDLQKLSAAASKAMQAAADPELSQYIVVMTSSLMVLLIAAGRMLEENRTKEAETLLDQADNLYHRLSGYHARSEIMILDAYLELIRLEITSSKLRALKMRSALQKVTSMQESLRNAAFSGQRKLRLDEKPGKLSLKHS